LALGGLGGPTDFLLQYFPRIICLTVLQSQLLYYVFEKERESETEPSHVVTPSSPWTKIPVSNPSVLQVSCKCLVPSCPCNPLWTHCGPLWTLVDPCGTLCGTVVLWYCSTPWYTVGPLLPNGYRCHPGPSPENAKHFRRNLPDPLDSCGARWTLKGTRLTPRISRPVFARVFTT
jgi:hypothetical protein